MCSDPARGSSQKPPINAPATLPTVLSAAAVPSACTRRSGQQRPTASIASGYAAPMHSAGPSKVHTQTTKRTTSRAPKLAVAGHPKKLAK